MKRISVALILIAAALVSLAAASHAWTITEELKNEQVEKLKAVEASPNDPHARFDLAITYSYTNKVEEGWDELKKVNELDETFAARALEMYKKKAAEKPNDWKIRFRLAFALYFNEKKAEAIEEMRRIINMEPKEDPKRIWAYGYMGLIYGEMDQVDNAIKYVKKGLKIDSNVAALHLLLASGYYKNGEGWKAFWEGMEALRLKSLGY